jgi:hypothetical protein
MEGRGAPRLALLRGELVMRDGEPIGEPRGQLVTPLGAENLVPV